MSAQHERAPSPRDGGLILAEELLLLAFDDEKGSDQTGWGIAPGLAGALLLDLGAAGCVRTEDGRIVPTGTPAPPHPLLADALEEIRTSGKPRKPKAWVDRLAKRPGPVRDRVTQGLVERGILAREERRVLGVFRTTRYPEGDPEPERRLRERLGDLLLGHGEPTPREALLLSVLLPYKLVDGLVPREHRKQARERAKAIVDRGVAGTAVQDAVNEIQAAVMIAVTAATITTGGGLS